MVPEGLNVYSYLRIKALALGSESNVAVIPSAPLARAAHYLSRYKDLAAPRPPLQLSNTLLPRKAGIGDKRDFRWAVDLEGKEFYNQQLTRNRINLVQSCATATMVRSNTSAEQPMKLLHPCVE